MNKVIITGATGMIGRALIDYLLEKNVDILAIVRENSKRAVSLPKNKKLEVIECDLESLCNLEIEGNDYDTFFHFAWDGTSGEARNDLYVQHLNIKYTLDAVNLAKKTGCKTFIGAGSQAEYGRVAGIISENTYTNPENGYGVAKLAAGQMSRMLANKYNIKHIWTRIFSVYGPYDGRQTLVISSIMQMLENNESPDYTKGEQMWDYIYSKDVARAFYMLAEKSKNNEVYCIAQGEPHPLYTYIEAIKNNINKNIILKLGALPYSDKQVMNLSVNIDKLKKDTGFVPETTFEEGIKQTIEWCKRSRNENEKN